MPFCPMSGMCPEQNDDSGGIQGCYQWGTGCPHKAGGDVYSKTMTMSDNNATRFESSKKTLRDVIILVETNPMLLGLSGTEVFPMATGGTIGWAKVDISTLYFKNAGAGNNGKITILGVAD